MGAEVQVVARKGSATKGGNRYTYGGAHALHTHYVVRTVRSLVVGWWLVGWMVRFIRNGETDAQLNDGMVESFSLQLQFEILIV